jgi:hypothetical protein
MCLVKFNLHRLQRGCQCAHSGLIGGVDISVGLCTLNHVDPYPIAYNLSNS